MAIKKYTNGSWVSASYRKYGTETDTITTLPVTIIGDGTPISSYTIKGNMEQSGTPTPENPILPSGCGELETTGVHAGQYKLPILSNSTVTNIYLGQVQTTRRVKKVVLTGNENWSKSPTRQGSMFYSIRDNIVAGQSICDRATNVSILSAYTFGKVYIERDSVTAKFLNIWLFDSDISVDDFKSYLAAQYAAGTPVTVWYVLAEPTTGIVNEPIRKIGDYVDSVSGTNLATSGTAQELDVGTTLKPSEFDLTYHGWHEHDDTKFTT